jgi:hypothetical protein
MDHAGGRPMAKPSSLDAVISKLRSEGRSDEDIAALLKTQAASPQPAKTAPPQIQGNMSGVLGNASAAFSYVAAAIFKTREDIEILLDGKKPRVQRATSAGFLAFKAAFVVVVCFAIYQEWNQHIIYETEITAQQKLKAHAESCLAMMNTLAQTKAGTAILDAGGEIPAAQQYQQDCASYVPSKAMAVLPQPAFPQKLGGHTISKWSFGPLILALCAVMTLAAWLAAVRVAGWVWSSVKAPTPVMLSAAAGAWVMTFGACLLAGRQVTAALVALLL